MSRIKQYKQGQNLKFRKWVNSKQKLEMTGHLILLLDITDSKGKRSRQIGEATNSDFTKYFEIAFDQAYLNAVYKHFQYRGTPILDSKNGNVKELIYEAKVIKWNIRYYKEDFNGQDRFDIRTHNIKGKRYTITKYKGVVQHKKRYKAISKKEITNLIEERSGSRHYDKKNLNAVDKNYFKKSRKNKSYLDFDS